jgi:branched-chain amino acid transport system permease protein
MVFIRQHWSYFGLVVMLSVISLVTWLIGGVLIKRTMTEMLIMVVVVVGLYIFIGNSGILSFGHIAFMAIGAYATAWQTIPLPLKRLTMPGLPAILHNHNVPVLLAAILAGTLALMFAFVVGLVILRLSGISASIATLAILAIVNVVYSNWDSVTLGTSTIVGLPLYVNLWVALSWSIAALSSAYIYQLSSFGIMLRATREDEIAAKAIGIHIPKQRLIAWIISVFFVSIGGVLYGHFLGTISVDTFYLGLTFITLAMLVVGGMNSLSGAVIGVVVISALVELFRQVEKGFNIGQIHVSAPPGLQEIGLAIILILILIFRPSGLTNNKELSWPWYFLSEQPITGAIGALLKSKSNELEKNYRKSERQEINETSGKPLPK